MNIQWILHTLATLFGITAAACALLPSSNKMILFICFALVAGVFELTIPFLNRSPIDSKPALTIFFDETQHCFKESNNQCEVYRIGGAQSGSNNCLKMLQ